jgi:hypothetical protein
MLVILVPVLRRRSAASRPSRAKPADFALDYPVQAWVTEQSKLKRRTKPGVGDGALRNGGALRGTDGMPVSG